MATVLKLPSEESLKNIFTVQDLQQKLQEKETQFKALEQKYSKLLEDFSYNVGLIYERDKEIDDLNRKIDELLRVNRDKDIQLVSLQSLYVRVKQLESDKVILSGRIEALQSKQVWSNRRSPVPDREESLGSARQHKRSASLDKKKSFETPMSRINSDLERRIQALEQETQDKVEDVISKEAVSNKEKEISDLIKSLSPYKRETKRTVGSLERGMDSFLKDVKKIKDNISGVRSGSGVRHVPVVRNMFS